ncbi:TonB-dependent receptor [Thalassotalea castellviae]|uniref:TonB-dependent receptor n=1 Tax=Thalassotalea castellviae TaxID=3075612 RepID=A0ABU3A0L4_9GAMM|nr:TonB-dependent receptor [Thalassotalea sp. W431]MDT0602506.1 TonB-dependent receptor [Thalassotalea sp. W431]
MTSMKLTTLATALAIAIPVYAQSADTPPNNQQSTPQENVKNKSTEPNASSENVDAIEVITVQGVFQADLKARAMERDSDSYSNVIATDDLGNFVDQNIAESLRRVPGVTLERSEGEGKYVAVRGLGPKFVAVSMNGAELSGIGDDRKVGLDGVSGDSLGAIEIFKTLTPEMNLNSIGGAVNIKAISAFDRNKDTLKAKFQESYNELKGEFSPKFSIDGTKLLLDEKLGVGFAVSYEDRKTQVDENRHHSNRELNFLKGGIGLSPDELAVAPEILIPAQVENRRELARRKRTNATLNIEFRPDEDNSYYLRGNYSNYTDDDIALREYYNFYNGDQDDEVIFVDGQTKAFAVSDVDVMNQYFIQEGEKTTKNFSIGAQHFIAESWTLDYEYAHSESEDLGVGDRRVQFRERENIVYGQAFKDHIEARVLTQAEAATLGGFELTPDSDVFSGEADGDISTLSNMEFDNLFMEDSVRLDKITSIKANLRKDFYWEHLNYIKTGFTYNEREHNNNKDRWSYDPSTEDCLGNEACINTVNSNITDYGHAIPDDHFDYPLAYRNEVEYIVDSSVITRENATGGESSIDSTKDDYILTEDTYAAYIMAELPLSDQLTVITGVRYVNTEFSSTGNLSLENDDWNFGGSHTLDVSVPLPEASIEYSEYFPSLHLRYEPADDLLVRGSLWTSFTRPSFKQARGFAKFDDDITLCDPTIEQIAEQNGQEGCYASPEGQSAIELQNYTLGQDNAVQVGNPNLVAMTSNNLDTSVGWYPSKDLFVEVALFYKDIDNFIVDVKGIQRSLDDLPLTLPVDYVTDFVIPQDLALNQVDITLNGDKATVYGIELSYNQFFENGLFWQSNMTFVHSEAELDSTIRDEKMRLPGQADITVNVSFGWEENDLSLRLIGNYRDKILEEIGSCPAGVDVNDPRLCKNWMDRYQDDLVTVDFKVKYDISDRMTVYFDAINITEQADLRYLQGNSLSGGNVLYQKEKYGSTYQLGINYKFH